MITEIILTLGALALGYYGLLMAFDVIEAIENDDKRG